MPASLKPTVGGHPPKIISALAGLNEALLAGCRLVSIGLVAAIAVIVVMAVVFRYGFNNSLAWSEDAAKFLMVWMTFIGAPLGFRHGAHVAVELLPPGLPAIVRRAIRAIVFAIIIFVMAILMRNGWIFAWNGRSQIALTVGDISMFWIFVCMPIGATLMMLVAIEQLLRVLLGWPEIGPTAEDEISTRGI
ncbi:MAG: TRAP transporter small permease [Hyphomicrobiaceae bacterium]|nr:TRAP transporter small permease [Hyphomicrobiaceae bacterium]